MKETPSPVVFLTTLYLLFLGQHNRPFLYLLSSSASIQFHMFLISLTVYYFENLLCIWHIGRLLNFVYMIDFVVSKIYLFKLGYQMFGNECLNFYQTLYYPLSLLVYFIIYDGSISWSFLKRSFIFHLTSYSYFDNYLNCWAYEVMLKRVNTITCTFSKPLEH